MANITSGRTDESGTTIRDYVRVARRRKWIILQAVVLVPAAAIAFSLTQTKLYQATAEVLLSRQNLAAALTGTPDATANLQADRITETQASLARVPDVARRVLRATGVVMTPEEFLAASSVSPKQNADLLVFTVTDRVPGRAKTLASAYAQQFTRYRAELDTRALARARIEVETKLGELSRTGDRQSELYRSLVDKQLQLSTLEALQTSNAYTVRRAEETVRVQPKPMRNAVLGLALGLGLGIGLAFLWEALDTRVRSATEIGEWLDLPLLARVPPPPKGFGKENRLVMLAQPTGTSAEAFRMLRTNLEFACLEGEDVRVILVTSAVELEGKSTTAANLALAEARGGRRVALVDLDLRRPYIDRYFGLMHAEGITNVALGTIPLEQALHRIDLAVGEAAMEERAAAAEANGHADRGSLDVLVAGPLPPDPGEFVGTKKLAEILVRLRAAYDLVIVDTPPALRVGDALALSALADGVLVITRLNVVRRPMLRELRRALDTAPAPKLGLAVTGSGDGDTVGYGYGYGYPYGGYGYGDPEKIEKERAVASTRAKATAAAKEADRV